MESLVGQQMNGKKAARRSRPTRCTCTSPALALSTESSEVRAPSCSKEDGEPGQCLLIDHPDAAADARYEGTVDLCRRARAVPKGYSPSAATTVPGLDTNRDKNPLCDRGDGRSGAEIENPTDRQNRRDRCCNPGSNILLYVRLLTTSRSCSCRPSRARSAPSLGIHRTPGIRLTEVQQSCPDCCCCCCQGGPGGRCRMGHELYCRDIKTVRRTLSKIVLSCGGAATGSTSPAALSSI